MSRESIAIAQCVVLLALLALLLAERHVPWIRARRTLLLTLLAAGGLFAYLDGFRFHFAFGTAHPLEFYHYFVGSKYFPELGYEGLYNATLIADWEDDVVDDSVPIRNLADYTMARRPDVLARAAEIKRPFGDERWQAFKLDVAQFRSQAPKYWRSHLLQDHGYNGTPLTTAVLSGIARAVPLSAASFARIFCWFDLLLIAFASALLARNTGPDGGLLFFVLFCSNPLNDYTFIGGSFLRYLYFVSLALGIDAYERGRLAKSGTLAAASTLLSVFPAVLVAGVWIRDLLAPNRAVRMRAGRPFVMAFGFSIVALLLATSLSRTPTGENAWAMFREAIGVHAQAFTPNRIGLAVIFSYASHVETTPAWSADGEFIPLPTWSQRAAETLQARRPLYVASQLALASLALLFLRRAPKCEAFFGGLVLLFTFVTLGHYYYGVLSLVPLMFMRRNDAVVPLCVLWLAIIAIRLTADADVSREAFLISAMLAAYMVAVLGWSVFRAERRRENAA